MNHERSAFKRSSMLCSRLLARAACLLFAAITVAPLCAHAQAPDFLFEHQHGDTSGYSSFSISPSWYDTFSNPNIPGLTLGGEAFGSASGNSATLSSSVAGTGTTPNQMNFTVYSVGNVVAVWSRGPATVFLNSTSNGHALVNSNYEFNSGDWTARYVGIPFNNTTIEANVPFGAGPHDDEEISPNPPAITDMQGTLTCGGGGASTKTFPEYPGVTYYKVTQHSVASLVALRDHLVGTLSANGTTTISATRGATPPTISIQGPLVNNVPVQEIPRGALTRFNDTSIDVDGGATYQTSDICTRVWSISRPVGAPLTGSGTSIQFTPANPGPYILSLTVTDNEGESASLSQQEYVVGGERECTPGAHTIRPRGCSDDKTALEVDPHCGEASITSLDPTATRGTPLRNEIRISSQLLTPTLPISQYMGNAFFTYGIEVVVSPMGKRFLVDGEGHAYDYDTTASGSNPKTAGVYPHLEEDAQGYTLTEAGAPHAIYEAGNFSYHFNTAGKLLTITDPNGNEQTVTYSNGKPSMVTDASSGKTISFTYNPLGLIESVIENGAFATRHITYDEQLRVIEIVTKDALNTTVRTLSMSYDGLDRLSTVTRDNDPLSTAQFTYVYGGYGRWLTNITHVSGSTNFDYFAIPASSLVSYRTTSTNQKTGVTIYDFDPSGNLVALYEPPRNVNGPNSTAVNHTFSYDTNRNLLTHTVGNTSETYTYNAKGKVTHVVDAAARFIHYTYAANGIDLSKIEDGEGTIAEFAYSNAALPHAVTALQDGASNSWSFARNTFGQVVSITPPSGSPTGVMSFTYDEVANSPTYGWLKTITNGAGDIATVDAYTPLGDPTSITTNPSTGVSRTVQVAYDATQRETVLTHADGKTVQTGYTGANATTVVDEAGTLNQYTYCPECGKLTGASGPLSWSLAWILDNDRDVSTFRDALQHDTTYTYGKARELKRVTFPDGKLLQYTHDNVGRVATFRNSRLTVESYSYDASSNLTSDQYYTYTYDTAGRLLTASGAQSTVTYTYGANRLVASQSYTFTGTGAPAVQTVTYTYNADQTLAAINWFNGGSEYPVSSWEYTYDGAGRIVTVTSSPGELTTYTYDGEGKLLTQTNHNGTARHYTYNQQRGWPTALTHKLGATVLASYDLSYDGGANTVGNLTGVTESGSWVTTPSTMAYSYDALYRLNAETRTGSSAYASTFGYDLAGNPTTVDGATFGVFNSGNKFTSVLGHNVTHDDDGNVTAIATTPFLFHSATWNNANKMTRLNRASFTYTDLRYLYDGKRYYSKSNAAGAVATYYVFAGDLLIGELSGASPKMAYTWGADGLVSRRAFALPIPGQPQAMSITPNLPGTTLWYHFGPQGETRYLTNISAAQTDSYLYSSYGKPVSSTGTSVNPFRYGGKYGYYTEVSTQVILATQRWYSPYLMRWLSKDPIGYDGGVNLYQYVEGNPVGWVDPSGLDAEMCVRPVKVFPLFKHCFVRFNGENEDTLSFDPNGVHVDTATWMPKSCSKAKGAQNDDCIRREMQKCKAEDYHFTRFNCCHCVEGAFKSCHQLLPLKDWPNWPINPGPQSWEK